MAHDFCHIELQTRDREKAKTFYGKLFRWDFEDMDVQGYGTYTMFRGQDGPGGGIMQSPTPNAPTMWVPYVLVEDVDKFTGMARELGGKVLAGPMDVPEAGRMAVIADPTGAAFGIWKSTSQNQDRERIKDPAYEK